MTTQIKGNDTSTFGGNIDVTGNVVTDAPAFSAYLGSNQTGISSSTWTKVAINTERFDTNSNYDNATNYRFTPSVAGYYQINGHVSVGGTNITYAVPTIYKNGTGYASGSFNATATSESSGVVSCLVYLNGTSDYIEFYITATVTSGTVTLYGNAQTQTYIDAALVRAV